MSCHMAMTSCNWCAQDNVAFDKMMRPALNGIWCCAPEGRDPKGIAYKHLREPEQTDHDGTLRHKQPPPLSMGGRPGTPEEPRNKFCQYSV